MKAAKVAPDDRVSSETCVSDDQQAFFANVRNKAIFIKFLSSYLCHEGFAVIQAEADGVTDTVAAALSKASCQQSVAVAADDTDDALTSSCSASFKR